MQSISKSRQALFFYQFEEFSHNQGSLGIYNLPFLSDKHMISMWQISLCGQTLHQCQFTFYKCILLRYFFVKNTSSKLFFSNFIFIISILQIFILFPFYTNNKIYGCHFRILICKQILLWNLTFLQESLSLTRLKPV